MTTLIIPAAGKSTRFPDGLPKFLWRHPEGEIMLVAGLRGLSSLAVDGAIIVSLESYVSAGLEREIVVSAERELGCEVSLVLLQEPTNSMVDTVAAGIATLSEDGPIILKDSDNSVEVGPNQLPIEENFIVAADLRAFPNVPAPNKSFVEFDSFGLLSNIVEKRITSSFINTGLVGFSSAAEFLGANSRIRTANEKYVSDVIRNMLQVGSQFRVLQASKYEDWGTYREWMKSKEEYANLMISIDGVIFKTEDGSADLSKLIPQESNIQLIREICAQKKVKLIFVSSRPESERFDLEQKLQLAGFVEFQLTLNLFASKSFLVSMYSAQDPFPNIHHVGISKDSALSKEHFGSWPLLF